MPIEDLDPIDRRILAALQGDGRLSNVDLASRVGLSPSPCLRRVKRLEREGYIDGYRAMLARRGIGLVSGKPVGLEHTRHEQASRRFDADSCRDGELPSDRRQRYTEVESASRRS